VLTKKGKYGLKAMVHLAGLEPGELAQVANIAETNSISKKFLDHILSDLRHAGLVYSKKGKGGGYALSRRRTRYAWERSSAPSMVLLPRFHVPRSPHFALATTAAIANRALSV
jgi:Iron-dependent Transcriptional regulator